MAKSFFDCLSECECDDETKKQIVRIYNEPFFNNPFVKNETLIEWCIEWEKTRKRLLNITAKRG